MPDGYILELAPDYSNLDAETKTQVRDGVVDLLKSGVASVTFIKKDGTEKVMKCTLQDSFLPPPKPVEEGAVPKKVREPNPDQVNVWDVDANGWRSFMLPTVVNISGTVE